MDILVAPGGGGTLELVTSDADSNGSIDAGTLRSKEGRDYEVRDGIPWMAPDAQLDPEDQGGTAASFGAKWESFSESERDRLAQFQFEWYDSRFGFGDEAGLAAELSDKSWILDAGSGPGNHAARYARLSDNRVVGMDLSDSVKRSSETFAHLHNLDFVQGDILNPPFASESFDYVVSDQVIHHTPDCPRAFRTLAQLVKPGGQFAVYVYKVKPLLRELADEHVREVTTKMS